MKKTLIALCVVAGLVGCGNGEEPSSTTPKEEKKSSPVHTKDDDAANKSEDKKNDESAGQEKKASTAVDESAKSNQVETKPGIGDSSKDAEKPATPQQKKHKYARTEINIHDTNPNSTEKDLIDTLRQEVFGSTDESVRIGSRIVSFERVDGNRFNIETDKRLIEFAFYTDKGGWKITDIKTGQVLLSTDGIEDQGTQTDDENQDTPTPPPANNAIETSGVDVEQMLRFEMDTRYDLIGDTIEQLSQADTTTFYAKTNLRELKITVAAHTNAALKFNIYDKNTGELLFSSET